MTHLLFCLFATLTDKMLAFDFGYIYRCMQEDKPFKEKVENELELLESIEQSAESEIALVESEPDEEAQNNPDAEPGAESGQKDDKEPVRDQSTESEKPLDQGPWLLVPRLNCDGHKAERLIHKPSIILGMITGLALPFVFLKLALVFHFHLTSIQANLLLLVGIFALIGQFKLTRFLTYRFRKPFFVEFAFGVLYPAAKLLSLAGLTWLEAGCFTTLGDVNQEFNNLVYTAECDAKVASFDKPFTPFSLANEREYAQALLFSGQIERAKHYVNERLRYWKSLCGIDNNSFDQAYTDYTYRAYFSSMIYESIGDYDKANELKAEISPGNPNSVLYKKSIGPNKVAEAELRYSKGEYLEAVEAAYDYMTSVSGYNWNEEYTNSSFMKARALMVAARCFIALGDKETALEILPQVRVEVTKDRSTINLVGEQLMLAEFESKFENKERAREILTASYERFVSPQSYYVAEIISRKAEELGVYNLFPDEAVSFEPEESSCKHTREECSYSDRPISIVAEQGIVLLMLRGSFVAGLFTFLASLTGHIDLAEIYVALCMLIPLFIMLLVISSRKSKRMARLRGCIDNGSAIPVLIDVNDQKVEIFDAKTKSSYGSFCINEVMHQSLKTRLARETPVKMYKEDDDILGIEIFGYATMVSKPKN